MKELDPNFDEVCQKFTTAMHIAADWKNYYFGAAYSTRLKQALSDAKEAITEAEKCHELRD